MLCCCTQAAVLGITTEHDVQEYMEKRVQSRFSKRKIVIPALDPSQVCKHAVHWQGFIVARHQGQ